MRVPKKTPKPPKEGDITETDSELSAIDMVGEDDEDDYIVSME